MSAISFTRRLTKRCLHRLMVHANSSVPAASPASQSVTAATDSGLLVENVRGFWSQSLHEVRSIGVEEKGSFNLRDECSRQQRGYARSNSEKARPDGDAMATQMIKYAATCRNQDSLHGEAVRVLEQGRSFLAGDGAASATATGRVLLTLASFYVDGAKLSDAVEALQQAADLEAAFVEVRVAALEALAGLCLRLHQEESALGYSNSCVQLVKASADRVSKEQSEELEFRANAIAALGSLVCAQCGAAESRLLKEVPSWIEENSLRTDGLAAAAAAALSFAECAHVGGHLALARQLYERAISIVGNSRETIDLTLASVAMAPDEIHVQALAGLGQIASHLGEFELAEGKITDALTQAEQINGDKHPRVGMVLACLADVYACRGKAKGTGDIIITEGLYRRALDLMGAPSLDLPDPGKAIDLCDVMALARARYADVICNVPNRETEAERLRKWANFMWKGPRPLGELLTADASQRSTPTSAAETGGSPAEDGLKAQELGSKEGYVVIDVRLGRVIWKVR